MERQEQDGQWENLASTTDSTHLDDTTQPNVPYRYRVQHRNQYGGSTWAESETVTLINAPGQPTGLTAELDGNDMSLSWTAPQDGPIAGYHVQHRSGDTDWQDLASTTAAMHRHASVAADVEHRYQVRGHNSAGHGPWSDEASATRITAPEAPESVTAETSGSDVIIRWTVPEDNHNDAYDVRHQEGDGDWTVLASTGKDDRSHLHQAPTVDVTHHYQVRSRNGAGESDWSGEASAILLTPPGTPTGLTAAVNGEDIAVSWTAPSRGLVDGYDLQHRIQGTEDWEQVQVETAEYTHTAPTQDVHHEYRVRTRNPAGESGWTETATARILNPPQPPTGLTAVVQGHDILVTWTAPETGVTGGYHLQHRQQGEEEWTQLETDGTTHTHEDPLADVFHEYRVRSHNEVGESGWTGTATARRINPPTAPTELTASVDDSDITIRWTAPEAGIVDGYDVQHRQQGTEDWTEETTTETSFVHTAPTADVIHEYQVRSRNQSGTSRWAEPVTATRHTGAQPPEGIQYQPFSVGFVRVYWTASVSEGVNRYDIRKRVDGGAWAQTRLKRRHKATMMEYGENDLLHEYQVRSLKRGADGEWIEGAWSETLTLDMTVPAGAVPKVRLNLEGNTGVRLHWDHPAGGQPPWYEVYRVQKNQDGDTISSLSWHTYGSRRTMLFDSGNNASNRNYEFQVIPVSAIHERGPFDEDNPKTITVPAPQTYGNLAPAWFQVKMLDNRTALLTWTHPTEKASRVNGYRIYRTAYSPGDTSRVDYGGILVTNTGNTDTSFIDSSMQTGQTYVYGVAARRDSTTGVSMPSRASYARAWNDPEE